MKDEKSSGLGAVRIIILIIALGVLAFAGYNLYKIMMDYHKTNVEYDGLNRDYTKKRGSAVPVTSDPDIWPKYEDAEVPMEIDWDELKAINKDVVGWVYMEGDEDISYPICWREEDDDYYLHRSYSGQYLYAGAIFLEGLNWPDLADPISIVYGHNMKNGSMFAGLKEFREQETYSAHPYFWILTPEGNYRYHIYSVFQTEGGSKEVYQLFSKRCKKFVEWEKQMQSESVVKNKVPFFEDDSTVILSTCESDHVHRNVVIGRCVSSEQPVRKNPDWQSNGTAGNTLYDIEKEELEAGGNRVFDTENDVQTFESSDYTQDAQTAQDAWVGENDAAGTAVAGVTGTNPVDENYSETATGQQMPAAQAQAWDS